MDAGGRPLPSAASLSSREERPVRPLKTASPLLSSHESLKRQNYGLSTAIRGKKPLRQNYSSISHIHKNTESLRPETTGEFQPHMHPGNSSDASKRRRINIFYLSF